MKSIFLSGLILLHIGSFINGESTSIDGIIRSYQNESTWFLKNGTIVLIIKRDANHTDVRHLRLNLSPSSFPINFTMKNLTEIKHSGDYLLSLLIFGYPHRLLWESVLFRQYLKTNTKNFLTFIVQDVSNLPKCLPEGYPCVNSQSVPSAFISVCCSNTRCERSNNNQLQEYTCGGRPSG
ncbi:unnamed protein product [Rotaria sordida]|uniref:Uncharacterized protein n=1 Tax=Rotaria sordida TaxID=392033 RepID=A0A813NPQ9_9BILA|nr:unnamed protein product [Rotaria sordida]